MRGRIKTTTREKISNYKKGLIFDYNWFAVREVFKNEKFYLNELFNDIINSLRFCDERINYKYGPKKNEVSLDFGLHPTNEEFSFRERAIQYIKISFLKYLENIRLIKNLEIEETLYLNTKDNNEYPYFTKVSFLVIENKILKKKMSYLISEYNGEAGKIDNKRYKKLPQLINGYIKWNSNKIPFQGSEGSIMSCLLENATIRQDNFVIKDGRAINRRELATKSEVKKKSFYEAMKSIHAKIKKYELPITINKPAQSYFHAIINI